MSRRSITSGTALSSPPAAGVERKRRICLNLAEAVRHMTRLLREENAALTTMDFARAGALLGPKHAAADQLASAWRAAAALDAPPGELRLLGELADENRRLVNSAMRVQRRVLDLITRAAKDAR